MELQDVIGNCINTDRKKNLVAFSSLLDEINTVKCISFQEAFEQFAAKIPELACKINKKEARRQFKDRLFSRNGLPVVSLNIADQAFVIFLEQPMNNISLCRSLDIVLRNFDTATEKSEDASDRFRTRIAGCIPSSMKLMLTSKDRAILTFVLSSIFSPTSLALGMRTQITQGMVVKVNNFLSEMDNKHVQVELEAEKHIDNLICTLETELESSLNELIRKPARLHEDECESRMFVTSAKRARLDRLKGTARNSAS